MNDRIFWPLIWTALKGLSHSVYSWTYLFVVLVQALFCVIVHNKWLEAWFRQSEFSSEQAQTALFMAVVHLMLFINTIRFLQEVTPRAASLCKLQGLCQEQTGMLRSAYNAFILLFVVAVFLSGGVLLVVTLATFRVVPHLYWHLVIEFGEVVSVIVFSYFVLADCACLEVVIRALRAPATITCIDRVDVESLERTVKLYILAVDLPGFMGVALIWLCSRALHPEFFQLIYWEGFVAGAIGLHVMFSQAALAFIDGVKEAWGA